LNLSPEALQFVSSIAVAMGAASLYLGAQNQRWLSRPLPGLWSGVAGAALLLLGVFLWSQTVQLTTAIFGTLALVMLLFIAFPCLGAVRTFIRNAP
jgi:hypothetical protein